MFNVSDNKENDGSSLLFSDGYLGPFKFKDKLKLILELINETSEEDIFGEIVRWRVTPEARKNIVGDVTAIYQENYEVKDLDEKDRANIYKLTISKYLEYCLCHEEFLMETDSSTDIRRLGLGKLNQPGHPDILYGICRIHETGIATFIGYNPDNLYPEGNDKKGDFVLTTEEYAMRIINRCNIVITPEMNLHKTIYYLNPTHLLPLTIPKDYEVIINKG